VGGEGKGRRDSPWTKGAKDRPCGAELALSRFPRGSSIIPRARAISAVVGATHNGYRQGGYAPRGSAIFYDDGRFVTQAA